MFDSLSFLPALHTAHRHHHSSKVVIYSSWNTFDLSQVQFTNITIPFPRQFINGYILPAIGLLALASAVGTVTYCCTVLCCFEVFKVIITTMSMSILMIVLKISQPSSS